MKRVHLWAACILSATSPLVAQATAGRIPLGTGATIVQTLSTPTAERESVHQVRLASDSGLHYEWRLEEVHTDGDTLRQEYRYLEAWSDIAGARRLRGYQDTKAPEAHPGPPDTLRVGCGGGETGAAAGNIITREGDLAEYTRALQSAASTTFLRKDAAVADSVYAALERVHFRTLRLNQVGNMTCFLELTDGEGKHEVSWVKGRPPVELGPVLAALGRAFRDTRRLWP